jgi:hypothetical protein
MAKNKPCASFQPYFTRLKLSEADLGTRQIDEDAHGPSRSGGRIPDALHHPFMIVSGPVRKIDPGNVHPRADQLGEKIL